MSKPSEKIKTTNLTEYSNWRCLLFGNEMGVVITPLKGQEPNWFWRWTQYLAFGFKWVKKS